MAAQRSRSHVALGRAIRDLRTQRNISQEDLAIASDLARKTVYQLEGGKTDPRFESLRRIASALNLRVLDIMALADELERKAAGQGRRVA